MAKLSMWLPLEFPDLCIYTSIRTLWGVVAVALPLFQWRKIVFQLERMEQICPNQLFPPIQEWKRLSCLAIFQHKAEITEIGS